MISFLTSELIGQPPGALAFLSSPIATPTYPSGGYFSINSSIHICAPPATLLRITLDPSLYSQWNSMSAKVTIDKQPPNEVAAPSGFAWREGHLQPGAQMTQMTFLKGNGQDKDVKMSDGRESHEEITSVEDINEDGKKGYRVVWRAYGGATKVLWNERVQEFQESEHGETNYITWETFGGPASGIFKRILGNKMVDRFAGWAEELKAFAEKKGLGNEGSDSGSEILV